VLALLLSPRGDHSGDASQPASGRSRHFYGNGFLVVEEKETLLILPLFGSKKGLKLVKAHLLFTRLKSALSSSAHTCVNDMFTRTRTLALTIYTHATKTPPTHVDAKFFFHFDLETALVKLLAWELRTSSVDPE